MTNKLCNHCLKVNINAKIYCTYCGKNLNEKSLQQKQYENSIRLLNEHHLDIINNYKEKTLY